MLTILPTSQANCIELKASGKLTDQDYQTFIPAINQRLQQHNTLNIVIVLEDFHGWELEALYDDIQFSLNHQQDFIRIAIVGDNTWEKWMAKMASLFISSELTEVRYYDHQQLNLAKTWVKTGKE